MGMSNVWKWLRFAGMGLLALGAFALIALGQLVPAVGIAFAVVLMAVSAFNDRREKRDQEAWLAQVRARRIQRERLN